MSLLLLPRALQAGTYAPVLSNAPVDSTHPPSYYSGGTFTVNGVTSPYTSSNGGSTYGGSYITLFQPASVQCGGAITATWQWVPANASDLPPQNVILMQTSSVIATSGDSYSYGGSATCADGLGGTFVPSNPAYPNAGGSAQSTKYSVVPGGWTVTAPPCSPSASASDTNPFATNWINVSYSAQIYPVSISLNGATADNVGQNNILVGQRCQGIISAGPLTLSNYQWTVPGVTFDHYYIASDQSSGGPVFVDPAAWTTVSPSWCWSSSGNYTVSVTAQASLNGQSIGSVTAQHNVIVLTPTQSVVATPGISSFETNNGVVTAVQAGPSGGAGMAIDATVTTPDPIAQFGYYGQYFFVQLVDNLETLNAGTIVIPLGTNGYVLDNEWPYNGYQDAYGPMSSLPLAPLSFSDNPDLGLSAFNGVSISNGYKTYLMYQPPGNGYVSQPVPIHLTQWNWIASAALNNGVWAPNPPGSCTLTSDSSATEFPIWSASFTNH